MRDMPAEPVAHGGVLLAAHRSFPSRQLELRTPLQAVAVRVLFDHRGFTVCSIYLPPGNVLPGLELIRLVDELPSPMLILGDFSGILRCVGAMKSMPGFVFRSVSF